jgi:hypothetical protein
MEAFHTQDKDSAKAAGKYKGKTIVLSMLILRTCTELSHVTTPANPSSSSAKMFRLNHKQ